MNNATSAARFRQQYPKESISRFLGTVNDIYCIARAVAHEASQTQHSCPGIDHHFTNSSNAVPVCDARPKLCVAQINFWDALENSIGRWLLISASGIDCDMHVEKTAIQISHEKRMYHGVRAEKLLRLHEQNV